jgi:hypothetical protein
MTWFSTKFRGKEHKIYQFIWESLIEFGRVDWQTLDGIHKHPDNATDFISQFDKYWCAHLILCTQSDMKVV